MPLIIPSDKIYEYLVHAQMALKMTQEEFAAMVGASRRTASRWAGRQAMPSTPQLRTIAGAVYPVDSALAAAIAGEIGESLESLELVAPPPPPAAPAAVVGPPPRAFPPIALMVDSIVYAAMRVAQTQTGLPTEPDAVCRLLHAAYARTRGLGLTIDEVTDAFAPAAAAKPPAATKPAAPKAAPSG